MIPRDCGVPGCRRTVGDAAPICTHHAGELAEALRSVPDLLDDLLVTISRQDRLSTGGTAGPPDEQPAPRLDVSRTLDALVGEITTWARDLAGTHGLTIPVPDRPAQDTRIQAAALAADWLADHAHLIRTHPAALEAYRALTRTIAHARSRTDRPPPLAGFGPCPCGSELRADPDAATIVCGCGLTHDTAELGSELLTRADHLLLTATELATALTSWSGESVAVGTVHRWHSMDRLAPRQWLHDAQLVLSEPHRQLTPRVKGKPPPPQRCCRPLYRVGDAMALLSTLERRPISGSSEHPA